MALASSSICPAVHCDDHRGWKYDVFLSFRGEDTRDNFISHLHASLSDKGIETFIDYQLRKGDKIAPALVQAIEDSNVAVVIFSENYANSAWCLDELVEIMECSETRGQIVIPVFYHVDPSHVRKQTGSFGEAFAARYEGDSKNADRVQKWKAALTKAANLAGWTSQEIRPERMLVDRIVKDVVGMLKQYLPYGLEGLVGLDFRIRKIIKELSIGLLDVRILGIWGMGGIGKTTIAGAVFGQILCHFEGCCFLENIREESEKRGIKNLLKDLLARTLGEEDIRVDTSRIGPGLSLIKRLRRKKLLIVLDDVDNSLDLECLIGDPCWFGPGSRVIITSRDKHVFKKVARCMYEVEPFNYADALELFSWNAFNQKFPTDDLVAMSNLVIKYAQGNPLALTVLGSFLFGKTKSEWESAVNKLSKAPNKEIQRVLKVSYDSLEREEKDIFLHVACFLKGESRDIVIQILDSCGFSSEIGLRALIDKSLITISEFNELKMHDLLQEVGKEIIRQESKEPGKRSRLWDSDDIYHVLTHNTGTEVVESISLNFSETREIHLCPNAFQRMPNLKFLKFYAAIDHEGQEYRKLHLSQGLAFLTDELRYLYWQEYPLQYLPPNFQPRKLFVLKLPNSKIKFWNETKDHSNLKTIVQSVIETPMASQVTNIVNMILDGCFNFTKLPLYVDQFRRLTSIRLINHHRLRSLPNNIDLESLDTLDLSGCLNVETFPEVSRNIRYLYLSRTAIKEVPPSAAECLSRLVELEMVNCRNLVNLPSNIWKLKSLCEFCLQGCSNLKKFPEILETMDNLQTLMLSGTAIETLPSSIERLKGLDGLYMSDCQNLRCLPETFSNLKALRYVHLSISSRPEPLPHKFLEEHPTNKYEYQDYRNFSLVPLLGASSLEKLTLSHGQLPADLGRLSSLKELDLRDSNFETIPRSIKQLSLLKYLFISNCQMLQSLPELPASLHSIQANGCSSLKRIYALKQVLLESEHLFLFFDLSNCFKLDQNECGRQAKAMLRNRHFANRVHQKEVPWAPFFGVFYPGSDIPEWFQHQSVGHSVRIQLSSNWFNDRFLGIALCFVLEGYQPHLWKEVPSYECCFGNIRDDDSVDVTHALAKLPLKLKPVTGFDEEHVVLGYDRALYDAIAREKPWLSHCDVALFKFPSFFVTNCRIKKCGVTPLYAQEEDCIEVHEDFSGDLRSKRKRSGSKEEEADETVAKKLRKQ